MKTKKEIKELLKDFPKDVTESFEIDNPIKFVSYKDDVLLLSYCGHCDYSTYRRGEEVKITDCGLPQMDCEDIFSNEEDELFYFCYMALNKTNILNAVLRIYKGTTMSDGSYKVDTLDYFDYYIDKQDGVLVTDIFKDDYYLHLPSYVGEDKTWKQIIEFDKEKNSRVKIENRRETLFEDREKLGLPLLPSVLDGYDDVLKQINITKAALEKAIEEYKVKSNRAYFCKKDAFIKNCHGEYIYDKDLSSEIENPISTLKRLEYKMGKLTWGGCDRNRFCDNSPLFISSDMKHCCTDIYVNYTICDNQKIDDYEMKYAFNGNPMVDLKSKILNRLKNMKNYDKDTTVTHCETTQDNSESIVVTIKKEIPKRKFSLFKHRGL